MARVVVQQVQRTTDHEIGGASADSIHAITRASYRYWPVLVAVSMARPDSAFLPVTRVRM
jgi:hypothetical protein